MKSINNSREYFKNPVNCPFCKRPLHKIKKNKVYLCKCPTIYSMIEFNAGQTPSDLSFEVMDLCNIFLNELYCKGYNNFDNMFGAVSTYPRFEFFKSNEISAKKRKIKRNRKYIIFIKIFNLTARKKNPIVPNYFLTIPNEIIYDYPREEVGRWTN